VDNTGKPLIDNIEIVPSYGQYELDFSLKPDNPSTWEIYLNKRYDELEKCVNNYHQLYLILQRIVNIVLSGKGITDKKVKYLIGDRWKV
jgi:hypothetical protein